MAPIDNARRPGLPVAVYALIACNVYVFGRELYASDTDAFIGLFATIPYNIMHGIVLPPPSPAIPALTILTSTFLHASALHITFNMLFLFVFGRDIERVCGHLGFVGLYLLCGIAGGVAMISIGPGSHVPEIGASGAIAGILGAYIITFPHADVYALVPAGLPQLRVPAFVVIGVWAAVQFVHGFGSLSGKLASEQGGTAYFAHIGGFCAGVLLVGLFRLRSAATRGYHWG